MIDSERRCQRCGRIKPALELSDEGGYQDAWDECQNPKCLAAEREAERAYWAAIDEKNQAIVDASEPFAVTARESSANG